MLWGILQLPRAVLRIPRRFKRLALDIEKIQENRALGDCTVAARRFQDPALNTEKIKENRALGDPPVAVRRFKDPAAF